MSDILIPVDIRCSWAVETMHGLSKVDEEGPNGIVMGGQMISLAISDVNNSVGF